VEQQRVLIFWENMVCGAVSRSVAQVLTHPANTMKTILQSNREMGVAEKLTMRKLLRNKSDLKVLTRGAGAQFVLSLPHGAVNFAVLEYVRKSLNNVASNSAWMREKQKTKSYFGPMLDFCSSAIATCCCSMVSTPQMMILDNIMAGTYPNLFAATKGLSKKGLAGFYTGWWPGLAGKIPSYALTWTLFQQLKRAQLSILQRSPSDIENSIMGCMASAIAVCVMIPMDTIKTRLVTQLNYPDLVPYKGIIDAAMRISREEGIQAFYRGLSPRLCSVVPMIGLQFGVYEYMKKVMVSRDTETSVMEKIAQNLPILGKQQLENIDRIKMEEVMMEVAADDDQPFPAPNVRSNKSRAQ